MLRIAASTKEDVKGTNPSTSETINETVAYISMTCTRSTGKNTNIQASGKSGNPSIERYSVFGSNDDSSKAYSLVNLTRYHLSPNLL
mmetsp:Transcript_13633/g.32953  ORF Transcript_13633/g.32953 Transcript_13633/m.32953 type:complete len:87 (-) Transcript_13633:147-407(-)